MGDIVSEIVRVGHAGVIAVRKIGQWLSTGSSQLESVTDSSVTSNRDTRSTLSPAASAGIIARYADHRIRSCTCAGFESRCHHWHLGGHVPNIFGTVNRLLALSVVDSLYSFQNDGTGFRSVYGFQLSTCSPSPGLPQSRTSFMCFLATSPEIELVRFSPSERILPIIVSSFHV